MIKLDIVKMILIRIKKISVDNQLWLESVGISTGPGTKKAAVE